MTIFSKRTAQAIQTDDIFLGRIAHAVHTDNIFFQIDSPSCSNGWQFFLKGYPGSFKRIPNPFKKGKTFFKHRVPVLRGTQRQFSKNVCLEDDLRSRIFGAFVVKFLACLPWDFETSKKWYNTCPLFFLTDFYPKKVTWNFQGAFFLAEIFKKVRFDSYNSDH